MAYEQIYGDWSHPDPGLYVRSDGIEVVRTGARTWTLTDWRMEEEERRFRTARAAMSDADSR